MREVSQGGQRARVARRQGGRPRRHLPADDPRGRDRDAGVRAHRRRCTRSSSAASRPRRCARASRTPRRSSSSPPTAADRAARRSPLKANVDEAVAETPSVEQRARRAAHRPGRRRGPGRDVWWHELVGAQPATHEAAGVRHRAPAVHPLHVRHHREAEGHPAHHRRLPRAASPTPTADVFDLKRDDDVYWCTADVGWVTGHTYVVYGPLANGATSLMYEGAPDTPGPGPLLGDRSRSTASRSSTPRRPRSARSCSWATSIPNEHDLSSLRAARLGRRADQPRGVDVVPHASSAAIAARSSTPGGRPRPAAIMISPLPGVTADQARHRRRGRCPASPPRSSTTRRHAGRPRRGRVPGAHASRGRRCCAASGATTSATSRRTGRDWPRPLLRRRRRQAATRTAYFWLLGRVDDVMNVSGHRLSTTEVESALVSHPKVAEAAVVGAPTRLTGQAHRRVRDPALRRRSRRRRWSPSCAAHVVAGDRRDRAARARSASCAELPKTRSGKIMRRLLRDVAEGRAAGDTTTLADGGVMDLISQGLNAPSASED